MLSFVTGPYFGRQDTLNKLISILDTTYDHIHGVCISGDAGIGKTRLALEACARMKVSHKLITVDLHNLPSIEGVYYAIMHAFGVECREFELDNLFGLLRAYDNSQYGKFNVAYWLCMSEFCVKFPIPWNKGKYFFVCFTRSNLLIPEKAIVFQLISVSSIYIPDLHYSHFELNNSSLASNKARAKPSPYHAMTEAHYISECSVSHPLSSMSSI